MRLALLALSVLVITPSLPADSVLAPAVPCLTVGGAVPGETVRGDLRLGASLRNAPNSFPGGSGPEQGWTFHLAGAQLVRIRMITEGWIGGVIHARTECGEDGTTFAVSNQGVTGLNPAPDLVWRFGPGDYTVFADSNDRVGGPYTLVFEVIAPMTPALTWHDPGAHFAGAAVEIFGTWLNDQTTASIGGFVTSVNALNAGSRVQEARVRLPAGLPAGTYPVTLTNGGPTTNVCCFAVQPGAPDGAIESLTVAPPANGETFGPDEDAQVTARVTNRGDVPLPADSLGFFYHTENGILWIDAGCFCGRGVPPLAPGETVDVTWTAPLAGMIGAVRLGGVLHGSSHDVDRANNEAYAWITVLVDLGERQGAGTTTAPLGVR